MTTMLATEVATTSRPRRWGTASRLATFHACLLAVIFAAATAVVVHSYQVRANQTIRNEMASEISSYSRAAAARGSVTMAQFSEGYLQVRVLPHGELVGVALAGTVLGSADSGPVLSDPVVRSWTRSVPARTVEHRRTIDGTGYDITVTPIRDAGSTVGTLVVATDLSSLRTDVSRVFSLAAGEAGLALAAAVCGAYLLLLRLFRSVGRITATATRIGEGELDLRLDETSDDEFGRLGAAFDLMADRLSAAMTAQRRLLSDVSHQLRTPLTVARGHLEVLHRTGADDPREVRETVELVVDELQHMATMVERLLLLGHAMEPDFLVREPVDLRSFYGDLHEAAQVLAPRRWRLDPVPDVVLSADPAKLRGALLNLVSNAVHATDENDVIRLRVDRLRDGAVALTIEDSGPGIPPERRAKAIDRFSRPATGSGPRQPGTGLGLAIVKAVADAHGGRVEIADSDLGGCRVSLVLPAAAVLSPEAAACAP